jgi:hypothetical protein
MKIERRSGFLKVDVQTRIDGNSSVWVAEDGVTKVFFGGLHAGVTLKDLRIEVIMNPDKGDWSDPKWARRKALETILDPEFADKVLCELCDHNRHLGKIDGRKQLQFELAELLGVNR